MNKIIVFLLLFALPLLCSAQYEEDQIIHSNEYGVGLTVAMSGFGFGGFYRFALPNYFHLGGTIDFYMMRDEKQLSFYDPYWGPIELNKYNRLFLIPLSVELKKRVFTESIENNFRPYLIGLGGITFGMNFPRESSINFDLIPPEERGNFPRENQYEVTFNFALGAGVDISTQNEYFISIRPQYRFIYFPNSIAQKKNHSNFEIRIDLGKQVLH